MKNSAEKSFDAVQTFRTIKEKIAAETSEMTTEQILAYFRQGSAQYRAAADR